MTKTTAKSAINPNLRHWEALGTTNPEHTKQFTRAGGFKGTAIKPIESIRRMTEHFGPCGAGWGMDKPEFQLVPIEGNGELMVFCTVGLWYIESSPASGALHRSYGVGGDKVITRGSSGLRTSDEAFKSAYTDALSNAMKHIGVGADVHMGLFDDSKYVRDARAEFTGIAQDAPGAPRKPAGEPLHLQAYEEAAKGSDALRRFWTGIQNIDRRNVCKRLGADPALGCPASLKQQAEAADHKIATARAESYSEQHPAEEPARPPVPSSPRSSPEDASTPEMAQ